MFSKLVLELDLLGDRDAVLGDRRRAEALLDDDVAALGAERDLDRVGEGVDAGEDEVAGGLGVDDFFGCHVRISSNRVVDSGSRRSLLDDAEDVVLAEDEVLFAVDLDLGAASTCRRGRGRPP